MHWVTTLPAGDELHCMGGEEGLQSVTITSLETPLSVWCWWCLARDRKPIGSVVDHNYFCLRSCEEGHRGERIRMEGFVREKKSRPRLLVTLAPTFPNGARCGAN